MDNKSFTFGQPKIYILTTKICTRKTENVYSDNQKYIFGQPEIYMWTTKIQIWTTNHL